MTQVMEYPSVESVFTYSSYANIRWCQDVKFLEASLLVHISQSMEEETGNESISNGESEMACGPALWENGRSLVFIFSVLNL